MEAMQGQTKKNISDREGTKIKLGIWKPMIYATTCYRVLYANI